VLGEHVAATALIGATVVLVGIWLVQGGRLPTLPSRVRFAPRPRASANPA